MTKKRPDRELLNLLISSKEHQDALLEGIRQLVQTGEVTYRSDKPAKVIDIRRKKK